MPPTTMAPKASAYNKAASKFVKWGKCKQRRFGCSKIYARCAAAAEADCIADPSCRAFTVKKLGGFVYLKYTDANCVTANTYDDRHWDLYTPVQAPAPTMAPAALTTTPAPPPSSKQAGLDALKKLTKKVEKLDSKVDRVIKAVR